MKLELAALRTAAKHLLHCSFAVALAACSITDPPLFPDDAHDAGQGDAGGDRSVPSEAANDAAPGSDRGNASDARDDGGDADRCAGVTCGTGTVCKDGRCVDPCEGVSCTPDKRCVAGSCEDACTGVTCTAPEKCVAGVCADPCKGVTCPADQRCLGGTCVDACMGVTCSTGQKCTAGRCEDTCMGPTCACAMVTCPAMQKCVGGACQPNCMGVSCASDQKCDPNNGMCILKCMGVSCAGDMKCLASTGMCVPLCTGVSCNAGQKCDTSTGGCVPLCTGVTCGTNLRCDPATGNCVDVCTAGGNGTEAHCCTDQGCAACEKCLPSHACQKEVNEDVKNECTGTCKTGVCDGQGACANSTNGLPGPGCMGAAITCQSAQSCNNGSCTRSNVAAGASCGTCATCNGSGSCVTGPSITCYKDGDNDNYGNPNMPMGPICGMTCPMGYVANNTDCCDTDGHAYPGAPFWHTNDPPSMDGPRTGCGGWDYDCNNVEEMQYPHLQANCTGSEFAWSGTAPAPCGSTASSMTNFGCPCNAFGTMACHFQTQFCR